MVQEIRPTFRCKGCLRVGPSHNAEPFSKGSGEGRNEDRQDMLKRHWVRRKLKPMRKDGQQESSNSTDIVPEARMMANAMTPRDQSEHVEPMRTDRSMKNSTLTPATERTSRMSQDSVLVGTQDTCGRLSGVLETKT